MKRKLIERTEPKAPVVELERQVLTAQEVQGILILNIFCRGELEARYAMNIETYEYECVELKDGIWKQKKIGDLWTGRLPPIIVVNIGMMIFISGTSELRIPWRRVA